MQVTGKNKIEFFSLIMVLYNIKYVGFWLCNTYGIKELHFYYYYFRCVEGKLCATKIDIRNEDQSNQQSILSEIFVTEQETTGEAGMYNTYSTYTSDILKFYNYTFFRS